MNNGQPESQTLQYRYDWTTGFEKLLRAGGNPASETRATLWLASPRRVSSPDIPDRLNNGQLTSPTCQH
ncbi:MAG: hypothetical protein ACK50J_00445, partial [Planctomyces sp.]